MNFQPVIPFRLSEDWTLVTRTIVPFSHVERYFPEQAIGVGDITQTFFFSPSVARPGLTVGFGAAFLYPVAGNNNLALRQWGAGPSAIAVQQMGSWTLGVMGNHLWHVTDAGDRGSRDRLNQTLIQPFIAHTFGSGFSFVAISEITYDWAARQWTVPIGGGFSQIVKLGDLPVNLGVQARWYPEAPSTYAEWGVRFMATFVFR